ncbi:MAG: hypothetical protein JNM88_19765 [Chitinophagaceae bacterium]|nr:hypothetical protein [Chitinophagaceae bacterium]
MNKTSVTVAVISLVVLLSSSCSKDGGGGGGTTTVDCSTVSNKAFAADVNPIIQSTCAISGCHASGSTNGPGALTSYTEIFNARTNIRSAVSSGRMPQTGSLSTSQKNSIICWIDGGAPNN